MQLNFSCYQLKIDYPKYQVFYVSLTVKSKPKAKGYSRVTKDKKRGIQAYHYRKSSNLIAGEEERNCKTAREQLIKWQ